MVTIENWEEYAILRADGELDAKGVAALETFLAAHPELAEEALMFDSLRLAPDETVVFAGKESLLKPEPRVIRFDRRWAYGVAAGVALLIGSLAVMRSGVEGTGGAAQIAGGVDIQMPVDNTPQTSPATSGMNAAEQEAAESTAIAQTTPSRRDQRASTGTTNQNNIPSAQSNKEEPSVTPETITPILSADTRMLAVTIPQDRRAESLPAAGAEPPLQSPARDDSHRILDRLPIEADRFALVDDLRQTASERLQTIRETREKLRNTDVTIALGRRDLFTLHF